MNRAKKIGLIVSFLVAVLIGLIIMWCVRDSQMTNQLKHKSITGTILAYQQTSEGLILVLDDDATSSDKEILIIENTMFTDDLLKQSIFDMKIGLHITVESEFWTQTYDGVYPAILISPAT